MTLPKKSTTPSWPKELDKELHELTEVYTYTCPVSLLFLVQAQEQTFKTAPHVSLRSANPFILDSQTGSPDFGKPSDPVYLLSVAVAGVLRQVACQLFLTATATSLSGLDEFSCRPSRTVVSLPFWASWHPYSAGLNAAKSPCWHMVDTERPLGPKYTSHTYILLRSS